MVDAFPRIFKRGGEKKQAVSTDGVFKINLEANRKGDARDVATYVKIETEEEQGEEELKKDQEKISEDVQEKNMSDSDREKIGKGKDVAIGEEKQESDDSSDNDSSSSKENPDEIVKMITRDMKNSKENIEDEYYIPMPVATPEDSEDSDNVPLRVRVVELSKKRKARATQRSQKKKKGEKKPRRKTFQNPKVEVKEILSSLRPTKKSTRPARKREQEGSKSKRSQRKGKQKAEKMFR